MANAGMAAALISDELRRMAFTAFMAVHCFGMSLVAVLNMLQTGLLRCFFDSCIAGGGKPCGGEHLPGHGGAIVIPLRLLGSDHLCIS